MADTFAADIVSEEVREFGLNLLSAVIISTPVDTGRARSNWFVTFDKPAIGTTDKGDRSGQSAVRDGTKVFERITTDNIPVKIYLTNNLPYIERLNEGWSAQAPSKYIDSVIERVVSESG